MARAAEPGEAAAATGDTAYYLQQGIEAQSDAAAARQRAAAMGSTGGAAYKTDEVQRLQNQALIHQAQADAYFAKAGVPSCQAFAPPAPPPSPELQKAQARLDSLRDKGWAYKSGRVSQAEDKVEALTPQTQY